MIFFQVRRLLEGRALAIMDVEGGDNTTIQVGPDPRELALLRQLLEGTVAQGRVISPGRILSGRFVPSRGVLNLGISKGPAYSSIIELGHAPADFRQLDQALALLDEGGAMDVPA